jgi:Glycosyl transferase family 2
VSPSVSVLIPTYQRRELVLEAIASAQVQSVNDIEIVVVDNASTDGTIEAVADLARADARIKVFRNDHNIGPVNNWRRAAREAAAPVARLLFSDDLLAVTCIEAQMDHMTADVGAVFSTVLIGEDPSAAVEWYAWRQRSGSYPSRMVLSSLYRGDGEVPVSPGAVLVRTDDLRAALDVRLPTRVDPGFEQTGAGPDLQILLWAATHYPSVGFVRTPLTFFRRHAESITISDADGVVNAGYRHTLAAWSRSLGTEADRGRFVARLMMSEAKSRRAVVTPQEVQTSYDVSAGTMAVARGAAEILAVRVRQRWRRFATDRETRTTSVTFPGTDPTPPSWP